MPEQNVIESTLYDGKVNVRFFPDSHIYMMNGKRKSGVTTFIGIKDKSRALTGWAADCAVDYIEDSKMWNRMHRLVTIEKIQLDSLFKEARNAHLVKKESAANVGDKAHGWIEAFIKGEKPEMPEDLNVLIAINGFLDWVKAHNVKFISSERVLYSKKHDYMGKMDIEATVDGKRCLVDIKTSNGLYNEVRMQTAAYQMADQEEGAKEYKGRWAIRISKETDKEYLDRMEKKGRTEFEPYVAFEAKFFSNDDLESDFKAFLNCKALYEWNKSTDFYLQRKNGN